MTQRQPQPHTHQLVHDLGEVVKQHQDEPLEQQQACLVDPRHVPQDARDGVNVVGDVHHRLVRLQPWAAIAEVTTRYLVVGEVELLAALRNVLKHELDLVGAEQHRTRTSQAAVPADGHGRFARGALLHGLHSTLPTNSSNLGVQHAAEVLEEKLEHGARALAGRLVVHDVRRHLREIRARGDGATHTSRKKASSAANAHDLSSGFWCLQFSLMATKSCS